MRKRVKNRMGLAAMVLLLVLAVLRAKPELLAPAVSGVLIIAVILLLRRFLRAPPERMAGLPEDFADKPWQADGMMIALRGRVERILDDPPIEGMKRWWIDTFRTWIGSTNMKNRFRHQRFLISSPALRHGEKLLVEHNLKYGRQRLRVGSAVVLRGEYIHKTAGGKNFYGRVHKTHPPGGYLRVE